MISKIILGIVILLFLLALPLILRKPSNDRVWAKDQAILPTTEFNGDLIKVHNIRNFTYHENGDPTEDYYDKTYDLNALKKVWYVVEPFSPVFGPAHTFLSFEFADNEFLAVSIEIRKQTGQKFEYLKSMYHGYELMYVIADERDVIKLRSNFRHDKVFLYPTKGSPEDARAVLVDMLKRSNELGQHPEFYNAFTNTCTTNIVDHVNKVGSWHIPFSWKYLLPAYSDELALDDGYLDTDLPLDQARAKFQINDLAEKYGNDPDFSLRIRGR